MVYAIVLGILLNCREPLPCVCVSCLVNIHVNKTILNITCLLNSIGVCSGLYSSIADRSSRTASHALLHAGDCFNRPRTSSVACGSALSSLLPSIASARNECSLRIGRVSETRKDVVIASLSPGKWGTYCPNRNTPRTTFVFAAWPVPGLEERSRTRGGKSGGVADQPQHRRLWRRRTPNALMMATPWLTDAGP